MKNITHVSVLITEDCNFRCDYCFIKRNPKVMKEQTMKDLIDWMDTNNPKNVSPHIQFFGGEPLTEWDLMVSAIEYAQQKDRKFRFGVTSNGSLLNDERIEFLKTNDVGVLFSIDGCKEAHNTHRKYPNGKQTFKDVIKNAKKAIKAGIAPTSRLTYTPDTIELLAKSVTFLLDEVGFKNVAPTPAIDSYHQFSDEDLREWNIQYEKINKRFKDRISSGEQTGMNYLGKCFRQILNEDKMSSPCGAGKRFAGVNWKGELFPCHRFVQWPEWKFGEIYNGVTKPEVRRLTAEYDVNMNSPKCASCDNGFCGGTCLAANYENNKNINVPSQDGCKMSKKQWNNAKKLYKEMGKKEGFINLYGEKKQKQSEQLTYQPSKSKNKPNKSRLEHKVDKLINLSVKQSELILDLAERGE
jgi:uncharacterized protein